jgi:hypothetical protein
MLNYFSTDLSTIVDKWFRSLKKARASYHPEKAFSSGFLIFSRDVTLPENTAHLSPGNFVF